ncbi:MAG: hypothetical protein COZ17_09890 [Flavobacteriaceae bacterium CG_4_10_14_3_um_filter_33_47]|nr:MAG: hypothetical protein COZ17_09890 [Flavobacteriaceae bacterium CG_4_10_14_3_um_filter_33_47]PJB17616.1 MAG: hypothetical protein CO117_11110 [Flavobacteriaceae bacterium CG_4_9_14_3_um_filter_33_16]
MSKLVIKMEQLAILRKKQTAYAKMMIKRYNKATDEDKKAFDDNAELLFETQLNSDIQSIRANIHTITVILVSYAVITIAGVIYYLSQS